MKITWIGHSCFKIEKNGYSIVTDPYSDGSVPGLAPVRVTANQVLISHEHGDHNARNLVEIIPAEEAPFEITELPTYHDHAKGTKRGSNTIHVIDDGVIRVAHFGDLGCEPEPEQLEMLKDLDVAIIPVGGFFTIDAKEAAELVKKLQPKLVIPMHFRDDRKGFGFDVISPVSLFSELAEAVTEADGSMLDTEKLPEAKVVVLTPRNLESR